LKLETAIKYMEADASRLDAALFEADVESFVIDSREIEAGNVFFAISQPDFQNNCFNGDFADGASYAVSAFAKGAIACVIRPDKYEEYRQALEKFSDRLIFVSDTISAFQKLAHGVYLKWNKPVVAITGSAGKTTAKELTAHVLAYSGRKVLRNLKNYNNGLGLPLTVLNLAKDDDYDVAVLEMGMSTPNNEIARLCKITPPDVAVALNVLPVHVEHLGSIENVARAKAELVEGMKTGGTAVLNADDFRVLAMRELSKGDTITYGIEQTADVSASDIEMTRFSETRFALTVPGGKADVTFSLSGKHNVLNALAAAAVGYSFGMSAQCIADALKTIAPPSQRGEVLHFAENFTVINDSYNSNPGALLSMVETLLSGSAGAKRRVVVAGEMLELGSQEKEIHQETGEKLARTGIDFLVGVRGLAREMVESAKNAGLNEARFFNSSDEAGEFLANEIKSGDSVLVKGSRGVRTEKVIEKITEKFERSKQ